MPNKQAAIKALRQTKRRTGRNQVVRTKLEAAVRLTRGATAAGTKDTAEKVKAAIKLLDRAAQKGVLKANTAARGKSRLVAALRKAIAK